MSKPKRCQYRYGYHPAPVQCEQDAVWIMKDEDTGAETLCCQTHRDCNEHEGTWRPVASEAVPATNQGDAPDAFTKLRKELLYWKGVVRGARSELHQAGRITDDEYAALAQDTAARDNMQTIDELREKLDEAQDTNRLDLEKLSEAVSLGSKHAEDFDAQMAALTHERDTLQASNATFQRLCREAQDAAAEACRQRDGEREMKESQFNAHVKASSERDRALAALRLCRSHLLGRDLNNSSPAQCLAAADAVLGPEAKEEA